MYSLDLATLLLVLQESRYTGQMLATIPMNVPELSNGKAMITVVRGHIKACVLLNAQRQPLLSGEQAFKKINTLPPMEWQRLQSMSSTEWSPLAPQERSPTQRLPAITQRLPAIQSQSSPAYPPQRNAERPVLPPPGRQAEQPATPLPPSSMRRSSTEWRRGNTMGELPRVTAPLPSVTAPLPRVQPTQKLPSITSSPTTPPLTHQANPLVMALIPERCAVIDQQLLASLPRQLRRVLVLIDGRRSIAKIAELLYGNPNRYHEVLTAAHELARLGIVLLSR